MTDDMDLREILRHAAFDDPDVYRKEIVEAADRLEELAASVAELEAVLRKVATCNVDYSDVEYVAAFMHRKIWADVIKYGASTADNGAVVWSDADTEDAKRLAREWSDWGV